MAQAENHTATIHASCVALAGQGALITGASGTGKSALALQLMALGAELVADDRTRLRVKEGQLLATAPETIRGQIEARFVGILAAPYAGQVPVRLVVSMDHLESERLPTQLHTSVLGVSLPLIRHVDAPHFASALCAYLKGDRIA